MSKTDEKFNRPQNQDKPLSVRENSNSFVDETTSNTRKNKRPTRGRVMSAASFNQLVSDVPTQKQTKGEDVVPVVTYDGGEVTHTCATKEKATSAASLNQVVSDDPTKEQAQCEYMVPTVTFDGAEVTHAWSAKATSNYSHREVKVIVHKTSSSSSSTCSSVRSVSQRKPVARHKYERPHDHFSSYNRHKTEKQNSGKSDCLLVDEKVMSSEQGIDERKAECDKTIELQVIDIAKDAAEGEPCNETKQDMKQEGGSLADMFDS